MSSILLEVKGNSKSARSFITFLQNIAQVDKSISVIGISEDPVERSLEQGMLEMKQILTGKKKGKTLDELFDEH